MYGYFINLRAKEMKIALIRRKYVFYGGAERFASDTVSSLLAKGHDIHIFASTWSVDGGKEIVFHKVPIIKIFSFLRVISFAFFVYLKLRIRENEFDIIQSNERTIFQDIYRAGDGCHREWLIQRFKHISWIKKLSIILNPFHRAVLVIEREIFKKNRYKKIIAISRIGKEEIKRHYHVPDSDIVVVYNGVDLERFHPRNRQIYYKMIREKHSISQEEIVLLFVGSGFERKGLEYFIRSIGLRSAKPLVGLIIGKGKRGRYIRLARRLGISDKIIFAGVTEKIERYYAASDIFLFPTLYEPFGNVHLEALASGLPVITSIMSGAAEILTDRVNGLIMKDPTDILETTDKIRYLIDSDVREQMGREARKRAEYFTHERCLEETLGLYEEVLKRKKGERYYPKV